MTELEIIVKEEIDIVLSLDRLRMLGWVRVCVWVWVARGPVCTGEGAGAWVESLWSRPWLGSFCMHLVGGLWSLWAARRAGAGLCWEGTRALRCDGLYVVYVLLLHVRAFGLPGITSRYLHDCTIS